MKLIICVLFVFCLVTTSKGQRAYDTTTTNLLHEIARLNASLRPEIPVEITAVYYMQDVDSVTTLDTLIAEYQIKGDNFKIQMDSIESIQNEMYSGTIYFRDSMIVVQKPVSLTKNVLQVDVMDPAFQRLAMSSITATDSGSYRKIVVHFDPGAIYTNYELVFHKTDLLLKYIKYSLRKDLDVESGKMIHMHINFFINQDTLLPDSVFNTENFFKVQSSEDIIPMGSRTVNFEVVNLLK